MARHYSVDALEWLLAPTPAAEFEARHWERAPLLIRRGSKEHYDALDSGAGGAPEQLPLRPTGARCLFSHKRLLEILATEQVPYADAMRVVRFDAAGGDGRMEAEPPTDGVASAAWAGARLSEGFTVQLFRPQLYCDRLWSLLAALECRFDCLVGASVYLTPRGCQGLAPHYDDVEVFILQTKGCKHWRVHAPREGAELPARPSADLPRSALGPPILEATLEPGDMLYLPRGFVHEVRCSVWARASYGGGRGCRQGCRQPALPLAGVCSRGETALGRAVRG
jgi:lysine-specific demethylase/histidyl-hydroxylase NO66